VPHRVPEGRPRGGATARRLKWTSDPKHGSRGRDHLRLSRYLSSVLTALRAIRRRDAVRTAGAGLEPMRLHSTCFGNDTVLELQLRARPSAHKTC
jgi:hypothetical protein